MPPKKAPNSNHNHFIKPKNTITSKETIEFRLLCSKHSAGGVIGHYGAIIKHLETITSSTIKFDHTISSSCKERLVHITGSTTLNRKFRLSENEEVVVSAAQEALVRVFDRIMEVEPPPEGGGGVVTCRLLVGPGVAGAVIGENGKRINRVCKETGGFVKVYGSSELLPACAHSSDELIQISGGGLAVKKALIAVSRYILQKTSQNLEVANGASAVRRPSMKMETGEAASRNRVKEGAVAEVVLKLLCPCDAAGAVLGFRGARVKALENETGASIRFSAIEDRYNERVITVSAFEDRKSHHSSAQNALVRVFNELMSSGKKEIVTARLLIEPSQTGCLNVLRDAIISCIPEATGATLQIMEQTFAYAGAFTDEKVIQINGEVPSVQIALFQVSWMLRDCVLDRMLAKNKSPLLPHKLFNLPPCLNEMTTLTEKLKNYRVTEEVNGDLPSKVLVSEFSSGQRSSTSIEQPRDTTKFEGRPELGRYGYKICNLAELWMRLTLLSLNYGGRFGNKFVFVTNTRIEISVPADVLSSVFCDDGSNLSRLQKISGAKAEVHDSCSGSDGKIIISGTPDQTLAAQSLLQAFIMSAQ